MNTNNKNENKGLSKQQVAAIWIADDRLQSLAKQWYQAITTGDEKTAQVIQNRTSEIRDLILARYNIILDGIIGNPNITDKLE